MKHDLRSFLLFLLLLPPFFSAAQAQTSPSTNCPGVFGACGYPASTPNSRAAGPANPAPLNGNGTLGVIYDNSACGLDFTSASNRMGKRFTPAGVNQPAPFNISGIPACAIIVKAYLWAEGSGNGAAQTATISGPAGVASYPMAIVGQGPDKCWSYSGSYTYRADVTASVNGNGVYNISGILTNPPNAGNDMDGATLLVVYRVPSAAFQGRIIISDGAIVVNGGVSNYTMPISPAVCGPTTGGRAFIGLGDIQFAVGSVTCNGTPTPVAWNWWNFETVNTTVANGATTSNFSCNTGGDCFNHCISGLYFRTTTCVTCTPTALTLTASSTPATCNNCNGTATVTPSPTGTYTYTWSPNVSTTGTATNLCPGNYTVTVSDACNTASTVITVANAGGGLTVTNAGQTNVTCFGQCTGSATVNVTGGTAPITYAWTPSGGTGQSAGNLCAGNYVCTATDANGCTGTVTITITEPPQITAAQTQVNVSCFGQCDASATVVPSGGNGTYTYNWIPAPGGGQGTPTATGLCAGTYTCEVSSPAGCTVSFPFTITEPAIISLAQSQDNVTCFGLCDGAASVLASGGTPPYSYNWSPTPSAGQGTGTASGLCPGTYTCTVTDANNCTTAAPFTVTQPPQLITTETHVDVNCFGACNGSATITPSGGTPPYSYSWAPSGGSAATASGLCPGTYTCTVTDFNGCTTTQVVTITEPPQLTLAAAGFNVSCFGGCDGQVVVIPTGGTGNYTFNWSVTACTSASCNNVCAGNYNVTVTDGNGCTATASATVTQPAAISITTSTVDAHCNLPDGSASATFSGGTGTLTPVWYSPQQPPGANYNNIPPGNYFVIVTDQNGCSDTAQVTVNNLPGVTASVGNVTNVSCFGVSDGAVSILNNNINPGYTYAWTPNVSTTANANNLAAGQYVVTVTDASGCTSTVTATVTEPQPLNVIATAAPGAICQGDPVQMSGTTTGGTPGFQYAWMPGPVPGLNQTLTPNATTTFTLLATDANGCVDSSTVTVLVNSAPVATLTGDVLSGCATHCVAFTDLSTVVSGPITQWQWDFGDGNTDATQNPSHCYPVAGVYTVTLTVSTVAGCSNTITMPNYITVYPNPVAAFTAGPQPTSEINPTITFTDGSTGASSWSWDFGDFINPGSTQQNPVFIYPGPGCFDVTLTVTTINGCTDDAVEPVCIDPDATLFVPNAFSPNGDGSNEIFRPVGIGLEADQFEMWIFDRWGNLIYHSTDLNGGWDGHVQGKADVCQEDIYVWKIRAVDLKGFKYSKLGHVSLIR
jgi:gliding motility-associated-like protein